MEETANILIIGYSRKKEAAIILDKIEIATTHQKLDKIIMLNLVE